MAQDNLILGLTVAVDAVNDSEVARDTWRRAGAEAATPVRFVLLRLDDQAEHRRWLEGREGGMEHVGDPTWESVRARAAAVEPWIGQIAEIDGSRTLAAVVEDVVAALRWAREGPTLPPNPPAPAVNDSAQTPARLPLQRSRRAYLPGAP